MRKADTKTRQHVECVATCRRFGIIASKLLAATLGVFMN
jgi:hypothetical protein